MRELSEDKEIAKEDLWERRYNYSTSLWAVSSSPIGNEFSFQHTDGGIPLVIAGDDTLISI